MTVRLGENQYGKAETHVVRVTKGGPRGGTHDIKDMTVSVALAGDFADTHLTGDNSRVVPTDTQKNTVFAFAKESPVGEIEEFLTTHPRTSVLVCSVGDVGDDPPLPEMLSTIERETGDPLYRVDIRNFATDHRAAQRSALSLLAPLVDLGQPVGVAAAGDEVGVLLFGEHLVHIRQGVLPVAPDRHFRLLVLV